jgi:hypothetical protein
MSTPPQQDPAQPPEGERREASSDKLSLEPALRAGKAFIFPFLFSWAVAYVGSARDLDWLHFTGLGGVGLTMLVLMVWLIR